MKYKSVKNQKYVKVYPFTVEQFDWDEELGYSHTFSWGEEGKNCESFLLWENNRNVFRIVPNAPKMHNTLIDNRNAIEFLLWKYRTTMHPVVHTRLTLMKLEIDDLLDKCSTVDYCFPCLFQSLTLK